MNIDSAVGQPYVIYEGTTLDTVLMNRLDGDAVGPVKVLVSNPVYSHDHQHVLIPVSGLRDRALPIHLDAGSDIFYDHPICMAIQACKRTCQAAQFDDIY